MNGFQAILKAFPNGCPVACTNCIEYDAKMIIQAAKREKQVHALVWMAYNRF